MQLLSHMRDLLTSIAMIYNSLIPNCPSVTDSFCYLLYTGDNEMQWDYDDSTAL